MSTTPGPSAMQWVKSSYSGNGGGNCVEWCPSMAVSGVVPVRDSKDPEAGTLAVSPLAWSSFVSFAQDQSI
ncbi:DUF397 domain-containing protein [Streptomyces sp. NPDC051445]|uniref:DUF397 domain-containing protein n=1 Tax=Streptomyces sp. NPDC051445 TaxID=3365653 RepID=UPI00378E5D11